MAEAPQVVVVGGGIAGLGAAHELRRRGVPFALVEAGPRWGGLVRTECRQGFLLEGGPDSVLAQKPEALALARDLGLADRVVPADPARRTVYLLRRGRLHALTEGAVLGVPVALGPLLRSRLFSWPEKARLTLELLVPRRRSPADESIAGFVRRRLGRGAVETIAEPLLAGIHAGEASRLSLRANFPRLAELEGRHGSLVRGLRREAKARGGGSAPAFWSLAGGLGELVDALVSRLPAESLLLDSPVRSLRASGAGFALELAGGGTVSAPAVVLAVPAAAAAPLVAPMAPGAAAELAAIRFASSVTVLLGCRREDVRHPLDGYGLLVARGERLRTRACSFMSTKLPGRAPEGHVLLRAFLGGSADPSALELDDAALLATVRRELGPVLGIEAPPVLVRIFRWPSGSPQMEVGHLDRLDRIEAALAAVPGLFLAGAGLRASGIPDVVGDARRVAARAAAAVGRPAAAEV